MKRIKGNFILLLLLLVALSGCSLSANSGVSVFQYKDSYVGDNSAVSNIVRQLRHNSELNTISLETKQEPYGITLEYKELSATNIDKEMKETVLTNATYLFTLIKNVDWITFKFTDQEFSVKKDLLQQWYGEELSSFTNETDLKNLIQKHLDDEDKVNQFFQQ